MNRKKFGQMIRHAREEKLLSEDDLATILGVSKKDIWRWEKGKRVPSYTYLKSLESLLPSLGDNHNCISTNSFSGMSTSLLFISKICFGLGIVFFLAGIFYHLF